MLSKSDTPKDCCRPIAEVQYKLLFAFYSLVPDDIVNLGDHQSYVAKNHGRVHFVTNCPGLVLKDPYGRHNREHSAPTGSQTRHCRF